MQVLRRSPPLTLLPPLDEDEEVPSSGPPSRQTTPTAASRQQLEEQQLQHQHQHQHEQAFHPGPGTRRGSELSWSGHDEDPGFGDSPASTLLKRKKARAAVKSSNYRGVSRCMKDGRWQARIRVGKRVKYLGRFKSEVEAAKVYDEAALALHGVHAALNFELSPEEVAAALVTIAEKRAKYGFDAALAADQQLHPEPHFPTSTSSTSSSTYHTCEGGYTTNESQQSSPWGSPRSTAARSYSESLDGADERIAALSLMSLRTSG